MADAVEQLRTALTGHYTVERELGRGGMATVYLADDTRNHRPVAVKVLHSDYASVIGRARFLREIEIAANLSHPGIIPLFDSGVSEDLVYYVMPYVEGESLRDLLDREAQLPMEQVLRIAREVAEALAYAHGHGVIHRDIKPANILLTGGHAQIADFGIARAVWASTGDQTTSAGMAVGTPQYMSPEQAAAGTVDARTDVWALGCVVYEMLAGMPPFTGATPDAVFARARLEPPPSLEVVRPGVGHAVHAVVEKALAKAPADRWQTVTAFVDALEEAARAPESGEYARSRPTPARWPWVAMAAAGAVAVAAGLWHPWVPRFVLDPNKVVVFPLREAVGAPPGSGEDLSQMISSAMETAEPLRVISGWTWLTPEQRRDVRLLAASEARRIARTHGARHYVDGDILRIGDSARVVLRLTDVRADTLVAQETSAPALMAASILPRVSLTGVARLLPKLLGEGRTADLSALQDPDPAAVAHWLVGERFYRRSQFDSALAHYRRALAIDSTLTFAAFKGAQAANWTGDDPLALALDSLALRSPRRLPARYRDYSEAFGAYLGGDADAAVRHVRRALAADSGWSGAWMVLGEIYYHLLPSDGGADSTAQMQFERAHRLDPWFAPAAYHLGQIELRAGHILRAESLIVRFRRGRPDSTQLVRLDLMLRCARDGVRRVDWRAAATHPVELLDAARMHAAALAQPACAEAGFRALLGASDSVEALAGVRWGALLGLRGLYAAEGRTADLKALLAAEYDRGMQVVLQLDLVDAAAGAGTDSAAAVAVSRLPRLGPVVRWPTNRLWDRGIWAFYARDAAMLDSIVAVLAARLSRGDPLDSAVRDGMAARLAVLRGDSAQAVAHLLRLHAIGTTHELSWDLVAPRAEERLLLARLLLARREYGEALRVAGVLDHPQPVAFLTYVPASLEVRAAAARAMGMGRAAAGYEARLAAIRRLKEPAPAGM